MTRSPRHAQALLAGLAAGAVLTAAALLTVPAGGGPPPDVPLAAAASAEAAAPVPIPLPPTVPAATADPTATTDPAPTTTGPAGVPTATSTRAAPAPRGTAGRTTRAPGPPGAASGAADVVTVTDAERSAAGCAPLNVDPRLTAAAQAHATDMAAHGYFSHTGRDGSSFADRIRAAGHPAPGAENIARGQPDAATVVAAWMDSPGHRRNILDCSLTGIGVGHDPRGHYWVQNFGR